MENPLKQIVADYPLHVDLELASICNLRCPMCYTISDDFKSKVKIGLMDVSLFKRLVDECVDGGVFSIRVSFRGESFVHDHVIECIRYAKEKGIKEVSSLTNGARLDEAIFKQLMDAGMDWLTISIDGVGEVYEEIRRPIKFDDMVNKLTAFHRMKKEAGSVKPVVKVQSIYPAIEKNPQEFYDIFAPITDMVSTNPLINYVGVDSMRNLPKIPNFVCSQVYQRLVIGSDGLAMMCTNDRKCDNILGDMNERTIKDVWHGPELTSIRNAHLSHCGVDNIEACAKCYLPIQTYPETMEVDGRTLTFDKYVDGFDTVSDLPTPARWKRKNLSV